jgi:hypothetical protein
VADVDTQEAFETLLGELQEAFEETQKHIKDAMERSDFSAIREAAERGETIQEQVNRLQALQRDWGDVVGTAASTGQAERAPRGASTPQKAYRVPILRALDEMGGQGRTAEVVDRVGELMEDRFTEWDRQVLPSGTDIRWRNKANWARNTMVNEGLLASDSPRGIWEITDQGRRLLSESVSD